MKKPLTIVCLLILFSIQARSQSIQELNFILGNWKMTMGENSWMEENWKPLNDSTLQGNSKLVQGGEEKFAEQLSIESRKGSISYIAVLPFKTAFFQLESATESSAVFVDPENDFPSKITYSITESGLNILLEGSGKSESMDLESY